MSKKFNRKEYDQLIEKLKDFSREHPRAYRWRVRFLGALGYIYILFVLAATITLTVFIALALSKKITGGGIYILIGALLLIWSILKALWNHLPPPNGYHITRKDAPKLFEIVDEICQTLKVKRPHVVVIDPEYNAAIVQQPRLGIFGWYKNYLVLGLPLLASSTTEYVKAVIAHECGHFAGEHGRFNVWVYRVREAWYRLIEQLEARESLARWLFYWFFDWYVPYFNAYTFVLSRANEYEADHIACGFVGEEVMAQELINTLIKGRYLEEDFWKEVYNRVNQTKEPPKGVYNEMFEKLSGVIPKERANKWLREALMFRTAAFDTHPALKDRLGAIGYTYKRDHFENKEGKYLEINQAISSSSATELLDVNLVAQIKDQLNTEWATFMQYDWENRYKFVEERKKQLKELEPKVQAENCSMDDLWDHAIMHWELYATEDPQETCQRFRRILQRDPVHAGANFQLGEILLNDNEHEGLTHMHKAIDKDPFSGSYGYDLIATYYERNGQYEEVDKALVAMDNSYEETSKATIERNDFYKKKAYQPHDLSEEIIQDLKEQFTKYRDEIKDVYVVKREVEHFVNSPFYYFFVRERIPPWSFSLSARAFNEKLAEKVAQNLKFEFGSLVLVGYTDLMKKAAKMPGSHIYNRKGKLKNKQ